MPEEAPPEVPASPQSEIPASGIRVTIRRKQSREDPIDHDVLWPTGWPIPSEGSIVAAGPVAGWVDHIEFDVDAVRVLILLR